MKGNRGWASSIQSLPDLSHLTWGRFLGANLVLVTIGNILGGALTVGAIYWLVYLRRRPEP